MLCFCLSSSVPLGVASHTAKVDFSALSVIEICDIGDPE